MQARLMRAQPHTGKVLSKLFLAIDKYLTWLASAGECVQENHNLSPCKIIHEIQRGRADVEKLDILAKLVNGWPVHNIDALLPWAWAKQQATSTLAA